VLKVLKEILVQQALKVLKAIQVLKVIKDKKAK